MNTTPLARLRDALESHGCKPTARGECRCPAHDDQRASLSIAEGDDGRALVHCHAGCTPEAIAAALGLSVRDLFTADNGNGKHREVAAYDYHDEVGELLYQVVRFVPKDFRQRRPDGNGGWVWKLGDTRRVLYRLPKVIEAVKAGHTIYIVEGEKDADTLTKWGLDATCNPGGVGKWHSEYSEVLRGARVVILPDADKPGRDHATAVAASLDGIAASVKVVELPGAKDVTDWRDRGLGTRRKLEEMVDAPDDWMRPEPIDAFMARELERGVPLVAPWLYPQDTVVVGAFRGTGKSLFGIELLVALTSATPAFGLWPVKQPHSVALFDLENPGYLLKERYRLLSQGRPAKAEALVYSADARKGNVELSKPEQQARLIEVCQSSEIIVFDNISAGYHAGPENDSQTWVVLSDFMLKLRQAGKTTIFMYQAGKTKDTTRGSSRLEDVVSLVLMLQNPPGWDQADGFKVTTRFTKSRGVFGPDTPRVTITLKTTPYSATWEVVRTTVETEALVRAAMLEFEAAGLLTTNSAIAAKTGLSTRTVATYAKKIREELKAEADAHQGDLE